MQPQIVEAIGASHDSLTLMALSRSNLERWVVIRMETSGMSSGCTLRFGAVDMVN